MVFFFSFQVQEQIVEYTSCETAAGQRCDKFFENVTNTGKTCTCKVKFNLTEQFKGSVFMYYGLSNFYQVWKLTIYSVIFCKEGLNSGTGAGETYQGRGKGSLESLSDLLSLPPSSGKLISNVFGKTYLVYAYWILQGRTNFNTASELLLMIRANLLHL